MSIESVEKVVPKLGYWKIRGVSNMSMRLFFCKMQSFKRAPVPGFQLAQPIRLILKYTGTEFENVFHVQGGGKSQAWSIRSRV